MDSRKAQWEAAYRARQNYVFWPHEEVVRFTAGYLRRRVGLDDFADVARPGRAIRWLDLGCGIGRHVAFGCEMGFDVYGIDLSDQAVATARDWAARLGADRVDERIVAGDVRRLPWADGFFDAVVSHGVLDSMHFAIARTAVAEVARVLADGGLFYLDLISADGDAAAEGFAGETIVEAQHERGTVQSWFDRDKIARLLGAELEIAQCVLVRREDHTAGRADCRWHCVCRKRGPEQS